MDYKKYHRLKEDEIYQLKYGDISDLVGRTIVEIHDLYKYANKICIECSDGFNLIMCHINQYSESVQLEDYWPESLDDIIGHKVISAECRSEKDDSNEYESATWTFYDIQTDKGYLQLRWLGESNGSYAEDVDCFVFPNE